MRWNLDPTHSQAEFSVRHMFTKVRGHMVVTSGVVDGDESDPTKAVIVARLDPASINTGVAVRDDALLPSLEGPARWCSGFVHHRA